MMIESIGRELLETFASIGDSWGSFLLSSTGEVGERFLLFLLLQVAEKNLSDLKIDTTNVAKVQEKLLMDIVKLQNDTEYGKRYNFSSIKTARDFLSRHPLTSYEDYRSIIDGITHTGDFSQLVSEPITLFQESSGTTGEVKLIPRTKSLSFSFLKAFQASEVIAESYFGKRDVSPGKRRGLAFINTAPTKLTPIGIPRGTGTSGGFREAIGKYKLVEQLIDLKYSSPSSAFLIPDNESAYYCHLLFGLLEEDLTFIAANFARNVLEAIQLLERDWQQLVNDIQVGQIHQGVKIDAATRKELQSKLKSNPRRARILKAEFSKGFAGILSRIWPQLTHIQCITTGSMHLYAENLKFYAGTIPFYSGGYGASEAWIGVNLEPHRIPPAYVITPHTAFFEFISEAEIDADLPSSVDLTSLKIGESYEVTVTTVAGLYRYRLGDVVKCIGYYNQSPIVEFLYRRQSLLDFAGEKVSEKVIWTALASTIESFEDELRIVDYSTRMEFSTLPWRYVIYVEALSTSDSLPDLEAYREQMDEAISKSNERYRTLRAENKIGLLELKLVRKGTFKDLKEEILSQGYSETQFKMPRLLTDSVSINFIENMADPDSK